MTNHDETHSIRYVDGGQVVLVTVPWGYHTGLIPPPIIQFGNRSFVYDGDASRFDPQPE